MPELIIPGSSLPSATMFPSASADHWGQQHVPAWASLLKWFYGRIQAPLPDLQELKPDEVPQPYKALLVHSSDMTPTLERFCGHSILLTVLRRERHENSYLREVTLHAGSEGQPVEYGVIRICLDNLPPAASRRVLEEQSPLGTILESEVIPHLSWPQAFFRIESDAHMNAVLHLSHSGALYGRRNVLLDASRRLIAEVIEILSPVASYQAKSQESTI